MKTKTYSVNSVAEDLSEKIFSTKLPAGTKLESPAVLAERYGISEKSIHRALNLLRKRGVIDRVHGSGSFVKTNIRPNSRYRIGVFLFRFIKSENLMLDYAAFDRFTGELETQLRNGGHQVETFILSLDSDRALETLYDTVHMVNFDMLIVAAGFRERAEKILRETKAEVLLIGDDVFSPGPWHQIFYDYTPGFAKALLHLQKFNVQDIYVIGVENAEISERRFQALCEAARLCNVPAQRIHRIFCPESELGMTVLTGQNCGREYLKVHKPFQAVISLSDYLTVGFEDALRARGLQSDRDVHLVSYDCLAKNLPAAHPELKFSAILHPQAELAKQVIRLVEELSRYPDRCGYHSYTIPATELILRK